MPRYQKTQQQQEQQSRHNGNGHSAAAAGLKRFKLKSGRSLYSSTRSVKFHVRYKTDWGQEVYLVGNCAALGDWDVLAGVRLAWSPGHIWQGSVELPAGAHIQYKYVVRNADGSVVRWQEGDNVSLELPGGPAEALALDVEDSWNKSKQVKRILAAGTPVRFNIRLQVEWGQHLLVVGSCASLGAWNVDNAVRLTWQEGNVWEASVELPAGELVEYKYVVRNSDTSVDKWQPGDNLGMEVPVAQGNNGRRRGVLVLDTWSKAVKRTTKSKAPYGRGASWRSTPYSSVPAGATGVAVHTDSPRFGGSSSSADDIDNASSAMAARSYYSMMEQQGSSSSSMDLSSSREAAASIRDPSVQQHDPSVMQHWTDKPRFSPSSGQQHQAHQDPWSGGQQEQQQQQQEPPQPQVYVPPPRAGAGPEEYARWQALQSVMAALAHSSEMDHWVEDPTDPRMLAADRRLAALTASLGTGSSSSSMEAATVTAMR
ncbi:hypothetical protein OEZ85_004559 [Tetradesmus obliquus]|uniref:CBM20 domain-containing protein n=1 Tax=Tetradesmus obliquus TaxID=3088 RepID=A0ABY8UPM4_TETOB|nr:hypothetical protein OEZ85_004559 [Tetradesmus obliquus]